MRIGIASQPVRSQPRSTDRQISLSTRTDEREPTGCLARRPSGPIIPCRNGAGGARTRRRGCWASLSRQLCDWHAWFPQNERSCSYEEPDISQIFQSPTVGMAGSTPSFVLLGGAGPAVFDRLK